MVSEQVAPFDNQYFTRSALRATVASGFVRGSNVPRISRDLPHGSRAFSETMTR